MGKQNIRIASYNIRKARGLDNRRMPERNLAVINDLCADIVLLQEADKRLGTRKPAIARSLIQSETDFELLEIADNDVSLGWHGNAILKRRGLDVTRVDRLTLPGLEPRGALQLNVDLFGGLCVVATHLGLRRRDRARQLEMLNEATKHAGPTIVAGDFNEWSAQKGFEPLSDRFHVHAPGHSFHASYPVAALDRFALSHDIHLIGGGVEDGNLARRASDHLPVWVDIGVSV